MKTIKNKAIVVLILFSVLPLLLQSTFTNIVTIKLVEPKLYKLTSENIENTALLISVNFQSMLDMSMSFARNENIIKGLKEAGSTEESRQAAFNRFSYEILINNSYTSFSYPFQYLIISKDRAIYTNFTYSPNAGYGNLMSEIEKTQWYKSLNSSYSSQQLIFYFRNLLYISNDEQIYTACNIVDDYNNIGIILMGFDRSYYARQLDKAHLSEQSSVFLIDSEGGCLLEGENNYQSYGNLPSEVTSMFKNDISGISDIEFKGEKQIIFTSDLIVKGIEKPYRLVMITPASDVYKDINYINLTTLSLVFLCLVAIAFLIALIRKVIINPILKLNSLVGEVRKGNLDISVSGLSDDELGMLGQGFNQMVSDLKSYIFDITEREKAKRDMEIKILQSQIKPHFVRNTLNTIRWMSDMAGADGVSNLISCFTRLLDYNFKDTELLATVREETGYLEEYIYLQQLRFHNKFTCTINIDKEIIDYRILKLSFQPIVENSIIHGLAAKLDEGCLEIKGSRINDTLVFKIIDDGQGMDDGAINKIRSSLASSETVENNGNIGIVNVHKRIVVNFGDAYGVTIESKKEKGTTVTIVFPLIE